MVALGVVPEAQRRAVVERAPEMRIHEMHPVAVPSQVQLIDHAMVEQANEVGARADDERGIVEGVLERAGAADPVTRLEHQHRATCPSQVGGCGQAVVAGSDHNGVPGGGSDFGRHRHARRKVIA